MPRQFPVSGSCVQKVPFCMSVVASPSNDVIATMPSALSPVSQRLVVAFQKHAPLSVTTPLHASGALNESHVTAPATLKHVTAIKVKTSVVDNLDIVVSFYFGLKRYLYKKIAVYVLFGCPAVKRVALGCWVCSTDDDHHTWAGHLLARIEKPLCWLCDTAVNSF